MCSVNLSSHCSRAGLDKLLEEQSDQSLHCFSFYLKNADGIANSVDPDQEQSDLGLHCLPIPVCPKT